MRAQSFQRVALGGAGFFGGTLLPPFKLLAFSSTLIQSAVAGTVIGWGDNRYDPTNVPPGLSNVVAISANFLRSLALKGDGTVVSWGYHSSGLTNVPPGLSNVVAVSAGVIFSAVLKSDGTVVG